MDVPVRSQPLPPRRMLVSYRDVSRSPSFSPVPLAMSFFLPLVEMREPIVNLSVFRHNSAG